MRIELRVGAESMVIEDGKWSGEPDLIEFTKAFGYVRKYSDHTPYPDLAAAQKVAELLGGTVTVTGEPPPLDPLVRY